MPDTLPTRRLWRYRAPSRCWPLLCACLVALSSSQVVGCAPAAVVPAEDRLETLERRVAQLEGRLVQADQAFSRQGTCSTQAMTIFRSMGYNLEKDTLRSQYNPRLQKCFMAITAMHIESGTLTTMRGLLDAFTLREYGRFSTFAKRGQRFEVTECFEAPLGSEMVSCSTTGAFEAIVDRYIPE